MEVIKFSFLFGILSHISNGSPVEHLKAQDISSRVVGGVDAPDNKSPHAVALTHGSHVTALMCGASIISECHILTAAHCIEALIDFWTGELVTSLKGVYGSNEWDHTDKSVQFSDYIIHEDYDRFLYKNDIGILYVQGQFSNSHKWGIIPLNFKHIGGGHKTHVTGWGRMWNWGPIPAVLQLIHLDVIDHEECAAAVVDAVPPGFWTPPVHETVEICAGHPKGAGFGVCNGDSGSALVSEEDYYQIGIVSWGFQCATGVPDIYVRVSAFKEFLLDSMKSCKCNKS